MVRFIRPLLVVAFVAPLFAGVGCDPKADSTPNSTLGTPPDLPPSGRGAAGGGPVDPNAPKAPKK